MLANANKSLTIGIVLASAALLGGCDGKGDAPTAKAAATEVDSEPTLPPIMGPERRILALGDSLFAGYGLAPGEGYPERLEAALRAKGINARMANAGVSGDTSAAGMQRLAFVLDAQKPPPDLVVISLGGNDMLRGLAPEQTRTNLDAILSELGRRKIRVLLMGMLAPPNLGADYAVTFNAIYPALARKHGAALVPFFMQAVIAKPDLIQPDRIHPTAQGIEAIVGATADYVAQTVT